MSGAWAGRTVGITGTCPFEVLLAAGARVWDLNNVFVTHPRRLDLLERAHTLGMAPTQCAWTRGMLGVVSLAGRGGPRPDPLPVPPPLDKGEGSPLPRTGGPRPAPLPVPPPSDKGEGSPLPRTGGPRPDPLPVPLPLDKGEGSPLLAGGLLAALDAVVVVARGDCSQNRLLADLLPLVTPGVEVLPFQFPAEPGDVRGMARAIRAFAARVGVDAASADDAWRALLPLRHDLSRLDELTWREGVVGGAEAFPYLIRATDGGAGEPRAFAAEVRAFVHAASARATRVSGARVALLGVPPIVDGLHETMEALGLHLVWHETTTDLALLDPAPDAATHFATRYRYAYGARARAARIAHEVARRGVQGVLLYGQSFCHHAVEEDTLRRALPPGMPCVRLEGDRPEPLDAAQRLRLEALAQQLAPRRGAARGAPSPSLHLGLDIGSRRTKIAWARGPGEPTGRALLDTVPFLRRAVRVGAEGPRLDRAALAALLPADIAADVAGARLVGTGYGRAALPLVGGSVLPEIHAHAEGARHQSGRREGVLVDLGGQDVKVIALADGAIADFVLNDKCAAGSGRYLENMARLLEIPLGEMLEAFEEPVPIAATCATFGETEVISRLVEGCALRAIAAGVNRSVVLRLLPTLARMPAGPLLLAGGAAGPAIARMLAEETGRQVQPLADPAFNGALGCLVVALEGRT